MAPPLDDDDIPEKKTDKPGPKERMAERAQKANKELDTDEDAPVIDVSERDDDEEADEPISQSKGSVRQEKKRNRYREMSERAAAAERARQETEARFSQMMSLYERTVASQSRPQEPQKDEFDDKLDKIYREQETLYTELQLKARTLTQQDKDRIERRARELDAEKISVTVQKQIRASGAGQQSNGAASTMQAMLQMEYPEIMAHEDALGWAQSYYQMARREGRMASLDLARESMQKARQRFRIGGGAPERRAPPPSAAARAKYAGVGASGGGRDADDERDEVVMSKPFRKMANGKYPHIKDEKKRYQMWAQGPGKRLLAAQRAKHGA